MITYKFRLRPCHGQVGVPGRHIEICQRLYNRRFAQFVTYKAELAGKRVVRVGEAFTTQVCAKCGKKVKRKLSERTIRCDCGHELDRDLNAAANILAQFLLSQGPAALSHEPAANAEPFLREWGGFAATYSGAIPAMDCRDSQETPAFMRG